MEDVTSWVENTLENQETQDRNVCFDKTFLRREILSILFDLQFSHLFDPQVLREVLIRFRFRFRFRFALLILSITTVQELLPNVIGKSGVSKVLQIVMRKILFPPAEETVLQSGFDVGVFLFLIWE